MKAAIPIAALTCALIGVCSSAAALPRGGTIAAVISIPDGTGALAVGEGAVWAVSDGGPVLTRIDPDTNVVAATTKVHLNEICPASPPGCGEAAAGEGGVWLTHLDDDTVTRVDPRTSDVVATIKVGSRPIGVATSPGAVWVANSGDPSVSRIDPSTNRVVATIRTGAPAVATDRMAVTAGSGAVWVTGSNAVLRIDPTTNEIVSKIGLSSRRSGQPCGFLAADERTVWSASAHCDAWSGHGVVTRLDARTNRSTKIVSGLKAPIGLALGFGSLWVDDLDAKAIDRVDPRTGRLVARLPVGGYPVRLAIGFGSIWVRDDLGRVLRINPAG